MRCRMTILFPLSSFLFLIVHYALCIDNSLSSFLSPLSSF